MENPNGLVCKFFFFLKRKDFWWLIGIYRKFFGAKGDGPQRQTKLSFSAKAGKKAEPKESDADAVEEEVSAKENADPAKGNYTDHFQSMLRSLVPMFITIFSFYRLEKAHAIA